ncbi:Hypothetical_protein [Hexamita inflata]|uniref:Hypothetical_protein n=1 Tax=Hexamita inflata TaxID=28002 RepID=A0AA86RBI2_9EUKA|nr:Hypothetical protein HINF_LOCUS63034 [Hexamita inflata]
MNRRQINAICNQVMNVHPQQHKQHKCQENTRLQQFVQYILEEFSFNEQMMKYLLDLIVIIQHGFKLLPFQVFAVAMSITLKMSSDDIKVKDLNEKLNISNEEMMSLELQVIQKVGDFLCCVADLRSIIEIEEVQTLRKNAKSIQLDQ